MNPDPLEKEIERRFTPLAKAQGWFVEKIVKAGRRGFPDRLYIRDGRVVFMEWKRPGTGRLSEQQVIRIGQMRAAGAEVHVPSSIEQASDILDLL